MTEDGDADGVDVETEGEPTTAPGADAGRESDRARDSDAPEDAAEMTEDAAEMTEDAAEMTEDAAETTEEADADAGADADAETVDERDDLVDRVHATDAEQLADEIATLREEVALLETENADLEDRLKRKQAEFQNYKKRMEQRREEERQRATEDLVERLLDVRDNLQRALEQEEGADIRGGVETTLHQFDRILGDENVEVIEPTPGEAVDPQRHEVLLRVESEEPEGSVADVHSPGYEMAGKVLVAAQVTVSDGNDE